MLCYSCNKQKNEINLKRSSLLPGVNLMMCPSCIELKYEPRWVVILAGRQRGPQYVREYIVKKRYIGNEILGSELIP
jgi:NMD protein affecting ribosome stability and mRNA decay